MIPTPTAVDTYPFLNVSGEMAQLIRDYDWASTSIGTPDTWPPSLKTIVGVMLNSRFPMFLWWGEEHIQFYNDAYRPSLGNNAKHPSALGSKAEDTWQEVWPIIKPWIDQVRNGGEAIWNEDRLVPIYRNGEIMEVYWTFCYSAVPDELGNVAGVLVTCTETTEKVINLQRLTKANEQLQQSTTDLQVANTELEKTNKDLVHSNEELAQYAYVASHDLQEPLRKIHVFASLLTHKEMLPEDLKSPIEKIKQSALRMSLLIKGLLDFSRLLKSETLVRPVALNEIAAAVKNDFELTIEEKKASIVIGDLPVVEGVSLQLNQLFYNLIGNALKFSKTDSFLEIIIHSEIISTKDVVAHIPEPLPFAKYYHIIVQDNGIGFDNAYSEQIFQVFKRLHGRGIYPGSGIGLALCRRIMDNHKGVLYAESKIGDGSVFHLIIPDRQHSYESMLPSNMEWNNQ